MHSISQMYHIIKSSKYDYYKSNCQKSHCFTLITFYIFTIVSFAKIKHFERIYTYVWLCMHTNFVKVKLVYDFQNLYLLNSGLETLFVKNMVKYMFNIFVKSAMLEGFFQIFNLCLWVILVDRLI